MDHVREESDRKRLQRNCQWCVTGRIAAAELDLFEWQRHDDCPVIARVLLAALFAKRGNLDDALAVLPRPTHMETEDDIAAAQSLVCLLVAAELNDAASRVLHLLHHDAGHQRSVRDWVRFMQMPGSSSLGESDAKVDQLAADLFERPTVIPSLVAAQRIAPRPAQIDLIRQALSRVWRSVDNDELRMTVIKAQAQLAVLVDAESDARRWAHRGLKINPYNAELALVLAQVSDDHAIGEPATLVLDRVSHAHPTYPDVRRALIEVEYSQGQTAAAEARLKLWLRHEPDHPVANDLARKMAA